jgi:hypothetical protein
MMILLAIAVLYILAVIGYGVWLYQEGLFDRSRFENL